MYCLQVETTSPDYKRPSFDTIVEHFTTKEFAEERLKEIKQEYIYGNLDDDDDEEEITVD